MRDAAPALELLPGQREALEVIAKSTSAAYRQVQRARALLLAADGIANTVIAAEVKTTPKTVRAWRERFTADGLAQLGEVRSGRGRKPSILRFPPERGGIHNEERDARDKEEVRPGVP